MVVGYITVQAANIRGAGQKFIGVKRAESLGLDVTKVEKVLQIKLPDLNSVVASILKEYEEKQYEI